MNRPYFLWDYDVDEDEFRRIIREGTDVQKAWATSRLINHAKWSDIWKYVTPTQVEALFPKLSFWPKQTREVWEYALARWRCAP